MMLIAITVFLFTIHFPLSASCPTSTDTNNVTCLANCCSSCLQNYTNCVSCSSRYYLASLNYCAPCTHNYCLSCFYNSTSGSDYCSTCQYNFGVVINHTQNCAFCYYSISCSSVNNCSFWDNCADCNTYIVSAGQCVPCSQVYRNCQQCNSVSCTSCYPPYYLNYSASNLQCVPCDIPFCVSCRNGPQCFQCETSNHYLYPNNITKGCQQLPYPCIFGNYYGYCLGCDRTNQIYILVNNTCVRCSDYDNTSKTCNYFYNGSDYVFNSWTCIDTYYLSNNTCQPCIYPCTTCTNLSCSSCADNLHAFNSTNSTCDLCNASIPFCVSCIGQNICTNCQPGYFQHFTANICTICSSYYKNCIVCDQSGCSSCSINFILSSGSCIPQHDSCNVACLQCTSNPNYCLSCTKGYYWDGNNTCFPCDPNCSECTSYNNCTSCIADMFLNISVCQNCPAKQYSNPYQSICLNCPTHCDSCSFSKGCLTCDPLFSVQQRYGQNICVDICGDGYVMDLPCDQIIGIQMDGCSNSCQVETDFNCTIISSNTTINGIVVPTNISSCSYIGNIKVQLIGAKESLFENSLFLTFKINPYLNGLPSASASQYELQSLFTLDPLTSKYYSSIEVDPNNGFVTFQLDHTSDISQSNFSFNFNLNILSANPMFQYLSNLTFSYSLANIEKKAQLGVFYSYQDRQSAKTIYYWSMILSLLSLIFLLIGSFSKQLAGLQQNILCQTVFLFLLFRQDSLSLNLLSLGSFHYSMGLQSQSNNNQILNQASYPLGMDINYFSNNFGANFGLYFLPIVVSLFFLAYKLRYKHLQVKKDFGQQISQYCIGKSLLEVCLFNFNSLISFSYLYFAYSSNNSNYWSFLMISLSVSFTLFSFYNFIFHPEIIGFFRSSFRFFSQYRQIIKKQSKCMQNFHKCLSLRPCGSSLQKFYITLCLNYYYIYLSNLIVSIILIILSPPYHYYIILGIQILILIFLFLFKPYFNPQQKLRSIFTASLYIFLTLINMSQNKSFSTIYVFLALLTFHLLVTAYIVVKSLIQNLKRKCNDRTKIVKELFKQYENLQKYQRQINQKKVIKQLIERYQQTNMNSLSQTIEMVQMKNHEELHSHRHKEMKPQKIDPDEQDESKINENQIINEENQHIRYQKTFQFFDKYGKAIEKDLVKKHYNNI